jgi:hypothetical protein
VIAGGALERLRVRAAQADVRQEARRGRPHLPDLGDGRLADDLRSEQLLEREHQVGVRDDVLGAHRDDVARRLESRLDLDAGRAAVLDGPQHHSRRWLSNVFVLSRFRRV